MKVVLMHDWLTGFRGGERVLEAFCEMFPEAPLYTLIHKKNSTSEKIENRKITASFLNQIPGIEKHYRKFLPLFPKAAESLKIIEKADVVLSSSHCVIKGVKKPEGSTHFAYIHSPMRYLYDQYDVYFGPHAPLYQRIGASVFKNYLTNWDLASNQNVDYMIANSHFVQKRIDKFYHQSSDVIHPFVDLIDFRPKQNQKIEKKNFYLMVTAFAPNKRVDLAISAFNELNLPLLIIGSGQEEFRLKSMASDNIKFLGNLSREEVINHYFMTKALIFPGVEDFGITPLEALASRTPVIAIKFGGVLETLTDKTAHFFTEATKETIKKAILEFEQRKFNESDLINRAEEFSKEQFKTNIMNYIQSRLK